MEIKKVKGKDRDFLEETIAALKGKSVRTGWFKSAVYPDGTPVASVAAQNEFGNVDKNIPPRPFMRPTAKEKAVTWKGIFSTLTKQALLGQTDPNGILEILGLKMAANIRNTIAKLTFPPLKKATVEARKRARANKNKTGLLDKPLIDTKLMYNTLSSEVTNDTRK